MLKGCPEIAPLNPVKLEGLSLKASPSQPAAQPTLQPPVQRVKQFERFAQLRQSPVQFPAEAQLVQVVKQVSKHPFLQVE